MKSRQIQGEKKAERERKDCRSRSTSIRQSAISSMSVNGGGTQSVISSETAILNTLRVR